MSLILGTSVLNVDMFNAVPCSNGGEMFPHTVQMIQEELVEWKCRTTEMSCWGIGRDIQARGVDISIVDYTAA
jgi:hypothetical protein